MDAEKDGNVSQSFEVTRAKFRMAFWLLLFFIITLLWASLTFPFLGYTSPVQNVLHGIMVASPFWIIVIAALLTLRRKMRG
jgi:hypothetical protein